MVFLAIAFFRHQATSPAEGGKSSSATVSEVPTSPVSTPTTPTIPRSPSPLPKTEQPVATPPKQGEKPKGASKPIHPPSPPRQPPVSGRQTEQASPPPKTSSPPKSSPPLSPQKQVEQLRREAGEALKEGRYEEAQQKLEKAIAIKEEASLHYELGLIAMQRDNLDLAQKHFERAVQLAPHKADYWASLGWLHLQKDETERAKQLFKKALSLDPNNKRAQEGLRLTE
jgi:TolA-binding protein